MQKRATKKVALTIALLPIFNQNYSAEVIIFFETSKYFNTIYQFGVFSFTNLAYVFIAVSWLIHRIRYKVFRIRNRICVLLYIRLQMMVTFRLILGIYKNIHLQHSL